MPERRDAGHPRRAAGSASRMDHLGDRRRRARRRIVLPRTSPRRRQRPSPRRPRSRAPALLRSVPRPGFSLLCDARPAIGGVVLSEGRSAGGTRSHERRQPRRAQREGCSPAQFAQRRTRSAGGSSSARVTSSIRQPRETRRTPSSPQAPAVAARSRHPSVGTSGLHGVGRSDSTRPSRDRSPGRPRGTSSTCWSRRA